MHQTCLYSNTKFCHTCQTQVCKKLQKFWRVLPFAKFARELPLLSYCQLIACREGWPGSPCYSWRVFESTRNNLIFTLSSKNVSFYEQGQTNTQLKGTHHFNRAVDYPLPSPGFYRYKFIIDGIWMYDINKPALRNEMGGWDNILEAS